MTHTILVVEDDPDIRELVAHRLEKENFVVHQAEDGQAAWDRLLQGRPDLMLVDVMMPRMDGEMLTMKVRKELKSTLPIIMVTAKGSEDDVVAGLLAGADETNRERRVDRWRAVVDDVTLLGAPGMHTGPDSLVSEPHVRVVADLVAQEVLRTDAVGST